MAYALRSGISYCHVAGRVLFLDLKADKYLCLAPKSEAAFMRASEGLPALDRSDAALVHLGLIEASTAPGIHPCPAPPGAARSLVDMPLPHLGIGAQVAAFSRLARAAASLRWLGFASTLQRLAARKQTAMHGASAPALSEKSENTAKRIAAAFNACDSLLGSKDRCLPRSIAAAHRLLDYGLLPHLVVGVRLDPFHAHAWTQWGDVLINEQIDATRPFTPILVL